MNAPVALLPQNATEDYGGLPLIFVCLNVPDCFPCSLLYPPGNYMGTMMLCQLLLSAIQNHSLAATLEGSAGPLNQALICLAVSNPMAALSAAKDALEEVSLLPFAELLYQDKGEGIWRSFLNPGRAVFLEEMETKIAAAKTSLNQVVATLDAIKSLFAKDSHIE